MPSLPELRTLVAELREVYQPIFGHSELSGAASRNSEARLRDVMAVYHALARQLQRPLRVLDLGCAQGWFGFNLAHAGAQVLGVDYLEENINVCNMLALENPHLHIRFKPMEIEIVAGFLEKDQFDLVLGLSVFHHLCFNDGKEAARDLLDKIFEKVPTGILEMALASESPAWAAAQPENPDYLIERQPFYRVIAHHATHLSSSRPLYFCSRRYWYLDGEMSEFSAFSDNGRGRRYFFGEKMLAKLYRTTGERGEINRYAVEQSARFLKSPPAGYEGAPKLYQFGEANGVAWLVQDKLPGIMLDELIRDGKPYDERAILLGVLKQLAVLERAGLYHADVRVWNILVGPDGAPRLIDYNEISEAKRDCVWPDSVYLAFFIFVNEVVTHRQFDTEPSRPPFISPFNLQEPYRSWLMQIWRIPVGEWSFGFLLETLENLTLSGKGAAKGGDSAEALWMQSIEQNLDSLNATVRSMSQLVLKLHEVVTAKNQSRKSSSSKP
jgi:O-antigen chain-terminating methyltransferase